MRLQNAIDNINAQMDVKLITRMKTSVKTLLDPDTNIVIKNTSLKTRMIMDEFDPEARPVILRQASRRL